jgi:hypothetical protein
MSGWSPTFPSKYTGSLRGKRDELGVWDYMITCKDRNGIVDADCECISQATGIPVDVVERVIKQFCEPDPRSRSQVKEGRRLEPVPNRGFGWRVVNHDMYRERARRGVYDEARTASGADAQRKRAERAAARSSRVPHASRQSHDVPLSYSEASPDTETESEKRKTTSVVNSEVGGVGEGGTPRDARRAPKGWKRIPCDWTPSEELRTWAEAMTPLVDFQAELEAIRDYEFKKAHVDPDATFRTWLRTEQRRLAARKQSRTEPPESKFQRAKRRLYEAAE